MIRFRVGSSNHWMFSVGHVDESMCIHAVRTTLLDTVWPAVLLLIIYSFSLIKIYKYIKNHTSNIHFIMRFRFVSNQGCFLFAWSSRVQNFVCRLSHSSSFSSVDGLVLPILKTTVCHVLTILIVFYWDVFKVFNAVLSHCFRLTG